MSYLAVTQRLRADNHLFSVLLELTYRCNLDCFFCYNDLSLTGKTLSKEQYFEFFDELAEMGVMNVVLTGGEPLAHPDFFEIGAYARARQFLVRIKSNGHGLRGKVARRVRDEIDPFCIDTSLHGGTAAIHDRQTRVPGSFDRLMGNLAECRALGLRVKINTTLTRWNEHQIEEIFAIGDRLDCQVQVDPEVTPRDDGDTEPLEISPSSEGIRRLFELQAARVRAAHSRAPQPGVPESPAPPIIGRQDSDLMKAPSSPQAKPKLCGAGSAGVAVDPFGDVYPCVQWRRAIGNLHEASIRAIWGQRKELDEIRQITTDAAALVAAEGEHGKYMSFCPGLAHTKSGNPLQIYSSAKRRGKVVKETYADVVADLAVVPSKAERKSLKVLR